MIPENAPQWLKDAKTENAVVEIEVSFGIEIVIWKSGTWRDGVWRGGTWLGGVWRGGEWLGGTWRDGMWLGGTWRGGTWRGGFRSICSKWYVTISLKGMIWIGCKEKTIADWDKWFKGKEIFSTPRDSQEFKMIYAHYRAMREYALILDVWK